MARWCRWTGRILLLVLVSTGSSRAQGQSFTERDSAEVHLVANGLVQGAVGTWKRLQAVPALVIRGDDPRNPLGAVVGAARLPDGGLLVADRGQRRVWVFGADGVRRKGLRIRDAASRAVPPWGVIDVAHGMVGVWDGTLNKLTVLDRQANVVRSRHIDNPPDERVDGGWARQALVLLGEFSSGGVLARTQTTMNLPRQGVGDDSGTVYVADSRGTLTSLGRYFTMERFRFDGKVLVSGLRPFGRRGAFAVGRATWFYTDGSRFEIQERTPDGALVALIRLARRRRVVDQGAIRRLAAARLLRTSAPFKESEELALRWMPYPGLEPAYVDLKLDPDGNLWAQRWSSDEAGSSWDVFDTSGRFVGVVEVPADLDVLEIGRNYLLARYTFNPGIEELRAYRLVPSG